MRSVADLFISTRMAASRARLSPVVDLARTSPLRSCSCSSPRSRHRPLTDLVRLRHTATQPRSPALTARPRRRRLPHRFTSLRPTPDHDGRRPSTLSNSSSRAPTNFIHSRPPIRPRRRPTHSMRLRRRAHSAPPAVRKSSAGRHKARCGATRARPTVGQARNGPSRRMRTRCRTQLLRWPAAAPATTGETARSRLATLGLVG